MLQKKMESMTMIVMPQMTEFVKKDVVLQHMRQTDDIEIQIDIIPSRTAAPVGGIMLNVTLLYSKPYREASWTSLEGSSSFACFLSCSTSESDAGCTSLYFSF